MAFVERFKARFGNDQVIDDPTHNAYIAVHLWARAVAAAGTVDPATVRDALREQSMLAPQGQVWVDEENHHLWRTVRIGQVRPNGQFKIVWASEVVVRPVPYPPSRTRQAWNDLLDGMYRSWGHQWQCPPPPM